MIVRELLTVFGVKYDDHGAKKAEDSIQGLVKSARVLVGAVAASAVVVGLKNMIEHHVEFANQLQRTSKRLGIQSEALQELRYAAEQAGIEQQTLDTGMQKFMIRTSQAAQGTGSAVNSLKELGVQLKDSAGNLRAPSDLIAQAADGFAKITSQADRARIAQTLFEEEGVQLIDMLQGGSAGLSKMRQEAHLLGAVMSKESINSSHSFWLRLKRIGHVLSSLRRSFIDTLMPALQKMAQGFEFVGTGLNKMVTHTTVLKTAMGLLGLAAGALALKMVIAFAPAILTFMAIAAAVTALILVVDDLYNLFAGGDSVIGRFFGKIKSAVQNSIPVMEARGQTTSAHTLESWVGRAPTPKITSPGPLKHSNQQNLKVDVHVKSGSNPKEIGHEVARVVGQELDRVHRNTYLALVPQ